MSGNVRFDFMHFMPYVHLPENHKDFKSLWVDFPNKYYDPGKGPRALSALSRRTHPCRQGRASTGSWSTSTTTRATA